MEIDKIDVPSDNFSRSIIAEKLVNIILSDTNISPVLINGGWGTGKTVLANRIRNKIIEREGDASCIYINAFQEDHSDNALITLVAAVASVLPKNEEKSLIDAAKPALRFLFKTGAKAIVSHITKQDADKLGEDLSKALSDTANATIDYTIDSIIKDHIESEKNISLLKEMLSELSRERKIIVIIDELDRCNPYFAIDLIEKIKYIFDMDNIKFILLANRSQLESSINNKYGGIHSHSYLEKFIKLTIEIPVHIQDNNGSYNASSIYFIEMVKNSLAFKKIHHKVINEISDVISLNEISLREVEHYIRNVEIYNTLTNNSLLHEGPAMMGAYKALFIFIYSFSNKFNITEKDIKQNPAVIMNISGLKYDPNSKLNIISVIASALYTLEYDDNSRSYTAGSDSEYNISLKEDFNRLASNGFSEIANYRKLLLSTFNILSFF